MAYQLLLGKKEVTYGTAPAMTAADAVWAENVQHKLMGTRVVLNPAKPGLGANPGVVTVEHAELTFETLLVGSGDAGVAPTWGFLAKAAGWGLTVVADTSVTVARLADPATSDSLAFKWSDEGRLHVLVGSRGKGDLKLTPGQPPKIAWTFRGILVPVAARTPVVPSDADFTDWPTAEPIDHGNTTFELDGVEVVLRDLSLTGADNVKFIDLPGQKGVFLKGDPSFSGSIKANVPPVDDYNPEAQWLAQSREPFTVVYGTEPGSVVTVSGVAQLDAPSWSKEDEFDVFTSNVFLVGSSESASDDIVIVIT